METMELFSALGGQNNSDLSLTESGEFLSLGQFMPEEEENDFLEVFTNLSDMLGVSTFRRWEGQVMFFGQLHAYIWFQIVIC